MRPSSHNISLVFIPGLRQKDKLDRKRNLTVAGTCQDSEDFISRAAEKGRQKRGRKEWQKKDGRKRTAEKGRQKKDGRKRTAEKGRQKKGGRKRAAEKGRQKKGGRKRAAEKGRQKKGGRKRAAGELQLECRCGMILDALEDYIGERPLPIACDALPWKEGSCFGGRYSHRSSRLRHYPSPRVTPKSPVEQDLSPIMCHGLYA